MNFRERVYAHLSEYRKNVLSIPEAGIFFHGGQSIPKGHILPREQLRHNILHPYRDQFFSSEHGTIKLHRYFHHLNSSQALCINLFFPLLAEERHDLVALSLGLRVAPPVYPFFESESTLEIAKRRTSFDFHLRTEERDILVEVKYTEDGFGAAKDDDEHRQKFAETYAPLLETSAFLTPSCHDCDLFLRNYQVLRNLIHITEKAEVVFLFPRANKAVAEQAVEARTAFLTDIGQKRLHILFLEDVLSRLLKACPEGALNTYYQAFRDKYLGFCD